MSTVETYSKGNRRGAQPILGQICGAFVADGDAVPLKGVSRKRFFGDWLSIGLRYIGKRPHVLKVVREANIA